jgi:putative ABC transport system ATP-binding protein
MQVPDAIEARDVSVTFGETSIFEGVSFSIAPGEHVALTGASGCGKSTLMRCLLGLVEPSSGDVSILGEVISPQSVWRIRRNLALVPQEADLGAGLVRDFIDRPFGYRANAALAANRERLPDLMRAVGLGVGLLSSVVGALSGGEKQRIALVSALLLERPILLLDEVTSALDRENRARVCDLLAGLTSTTIVGIVHEGEGMPFATRQIAVDGGTM